LLVFSLEGLHQLFQLIIPGLHVLRVLLQQEALVVSFLAELDPEALLLLPELLDLELELLVAGRELLKFLLLDLELPF